MPPRYTYPRSHRLSGKLQFAAVYEGGRKESRGPVTALAIPNDLPHTRLGLSVSRRVGTAPRRNRIKRLLREAFRLHRHDCPRGYDLVIVVRPHEPMILAEYQKLMTALILKLHKKWETSAPTAPGHTGSDLPDTGRL